MDTWDISIYNTDKKQTNKWVEKGRLDQEMAHTACHTSQPLGDRSHCVPRPCVCVCVCVCACARVVCTEPIVKSCRFKEMCKRLQPVRQSKYPLCWSILTAVSSDKTPRLHPTSPPKYYTNTHTYIKKTEGGITWQGDGVPLWETESQTWWGTGGTHHAAKYKWERLNGRRNEEQVEHITLQNTSGRLNGRRNEEQVEHITLQNTNERLNGRRNEEQVEHITLQNTSERLSHRHDEEQVEHITLQNMTGGKASHQTNYAITSKPLCIYFPLTGTR